MHQVFVYSSGASSPSSNSDDEGSVPLNVDEAEIMNLRSQVGSDVPLVILTRLMETITLVVLHPGSQTLLCFKPQIRIPCQQLYTFGQQDMFRNLDFSQINFKKSKCVLKHIM